MLESKMFLDISNTHQGDGASNSIPSILSLWVSTIKLTSLPEAKIIEPLQLDKKGITGTTYLLSRKEFFCDYCTPRLVSI
jgi:hypothetical protein